jgi:hypothetical protein
VDRVVAIIAAKKILEAIGFAEARAQVDVDRPKIFTDRENRT